MMASLSAAVVRLPSRLRALRSPDPGTSNSPLDALLSSGAIGAREHAGGLAYAALRRRFDRAGGPMRSWRDPSGMSDAAWHALKARHAALIEAARFERFMLDRLCLDGEAPMRCEVGRVAEALGRVASSIGERE